MMDDTHGDNRRVTQPFRIVRVDPNTKIDHAFSGQQNRSASPDILNFGRQALLDPTRRLFYELSCPIDCPPSELETLYALLSNDATATDELLLFSDRLWPLARANFIAHVVSRRPADGALLYALLESHAFIDANAVYAQLRAARLAEGSAAPSRPSLGQGLDELLNIHCAAAFVGCDVIPGAIQPVLQCTQQILAQDEHHLAKVLGRLLGSYRQFTDPLQKRVTEQVAAACIALEEQPDDGSLVEELEGAVHAWMLVASPLLIWNAHQNHHGFDFDAPIDRLRALNARLLQSKKYDVAIRIAEITRELFRAVPTTIDQLVEDARLIEELTLYASIRQLQTAIDGLESNPGPLIAALERDGFGQTSTEPARSLRRTFVRATKATSLPASAETPWRMIQDFAIRLSNRPEAAAAVARLLAGLIEDGRHVAAAPQFINALRDNLSFMQSFIGPNPIETSKVAETSKPRKVAPTSKLGSLASTFFRRQTNPGKTILTHWRNRPVGLAISAFLVSVACGSVLYLGFDQARTFWTKLFLGAPTQPAMLTSSGEMMPPVGTGQRLALDGLRYCQFQQERLRIIKQAVQGPRDTRAYNLLIIDYNSRCSDFFYQDDDLKTVLAEGNAKREQLEADAKRIMSTWPGREGTLKN